MSVSGSVSGGASGAGRARVVLVRHLAHGIGAPAYCVRIFFYGSQSRDGAFFVTMNCSHVDDAVSRVHDGIAGGAAGGALLLASLLLLCGGGRALRPVAFVLGASIGAWGAYRVTAPLACESRLAIAAACGVALASLLLCVLRVALALALATGFGVAAHFVAEGTGLPDASSFEVLGAPGYHAIAVGGAALVGAIGACAFEERALTFAACALGGSAAAAGLHLLVHAAGGTFHPLAAVASGGMLALLGCAAQRRRQTST